MVLHYFPPAKNVPGCRKIGDAKSYSLFPEALQERVLNVTGPEFSSRIGRHAAYELRLALVLLPGVAEKLSFYRRPQRPVILLLSPVDYIFTAEIEQQSNAVFP